MTVFWVDGSAVRTLNLTHFFLFGLLIFDHLVHIHTMAVLSELENFTNLQNSELFKEL